MLTPCFPPQRRALDTNTLRTTPHTGQGTQWEARSSVETQTYLSLWLGTDAYRGRLEERKELRGNSIFWLAFYHWQHWRENISTPTERQMQICESENQISSLGMTGAMTQLRALLLLQRT